MKKLVLMFVAVAAISFASCGGEKKAAPAEGEAPVEEMVEEAVDSAAAAVDSVATDSATVAE